MKVTKEVQNYLDKKLSKVYEIKRAPLIERSNAERQKIISVMDELYVYIADRLNKEFGDTIAPQNVSLSINSYYRSDYGSDRGYRSPEFKKIDEEHGRINMMQREKLDDIVVELALGGTKDDLDRLISEAEDELLKQ